MYQNFTLFFSRGYYMKKYTYLLWILTLLSIFTLTSQALSQPLNTAHSPIILKNTLYVDDDNTQGPWDGTQDYPYQYIQDAIDTATPYNIIFVFSGTYREHLIITKSLQIHGENTTSTIINGEGSLIIVDIQADNTIFQNFTIKNSNGNHGNAGIKIRAKNIMIHSCHIYRTRTAIAIENTSEFTINHCHTYINGEGILISNSTNGLIHFVYITQNGVGLRITQSINISTELSYIHTNGIGVFITNSLHLSFETCAISRNCDNQGAIFIYDS